MLSPYWTPICQNLNGTSQYICASRKVLNWYSHLFFSNISIPFKHFLHYRVSDSGTTVDQNCTYIQNPSYPSTYTTAGTVTYSVSPCQDGNVLRKYILLIKCYIKGHFFTGEKFYSRGLNSSYRILYFKQITLMIFWQKTV